MNEIKNIFIYVFFGIVLYLIFKKTKMTVQKITRGIRNNNPFNIKKGKQKIWQGEIFPGTDKDFCQFSSLEYGIRAGLKLLKNNYLNLTLKQAINKYAPKNENDTNAYIKFVSEKTGINETDILNKDNYLFIAYAILWFENGFPVVSYNELKRIENIYNI